MTVASPGRVGVVDWGIGGLDVLRKLRACGDRRPALYLSDAGHMPYGKTPAPELATRVAELLRWLRAQGCATVVVGCNAASTVLHEDPVAHLVREGLEVHGVIDVAVEATLREGTDHVLIIGGARTIESARHADALQQRSSRRLRIVARVAQPLSALIEAGVLEGPRLDEALSGIFAGCGDATTLISACTHYLAVESAMRQRLPRLRVLIDPAQHVAASIALEPGSDSSAAITDRFITTGAPAASQRAAFAAFGFDAPFQAAPSAIERPR